MNKRRIVYTGPFDPTLCDGVSGTMFDLLTFLGKRGHKVSILSLMQHNDLTRQFLAQKIAQLNAEIISRETNSSHFILKGINIHYEVLPFNRNEVLLNHPKILKRYIRKIEAYPDSFYFTVDYDFTSLTAHSILGTSSAHHILSPAHSLRSYSCSPYFRRVLGGRTVFTVSRVAQRQLKQNLNVHALLWPPFIDSRRFRFSRKDKSQLKIGYYSAGPLKGDSLVHRIIQALPHCRFVIMGHHSGSDMKRANITHMGKTRHLEDFYGEISLLLVPSIAAEGLPRTILEASFNGIPVIANRIGGIPEALGHSGILIDIEPSEDAMASRYISAITKLFEDPHEYEKLSKRASERACEYERELHRTSVYYEKMFLCE